MTLKDATELLERFGFPTAMCVWFMWREGRREKEMRGITKQVARMTAVLVTMAGNLDVEEVTQSRKLLEESVEEKDE